MKGGSLPANILRLAKLARNDQPKAIVSFGIPANLAGRFSRVFTPRTRLVTSIRTQNVSGIKGRLVRLTKRLDRWTVYNSRKVAEIHCAEGISLCDRAKTIYNSVSLPPCSVGARDEIRDRLGLKQGEFLWGTIGRMEAVKDHLMLIESGRETWLTQSKLVIVGDGPLRGEIDQLVEHLGLQDRVFLPGRQSNISDWCSAMDAFVLSSKWEGMPNGLLEAMQCGLPCVSTDVGGVAEVLEGGQNGLLAPPENPERLSKAMMALMAMPLAERDALATRGQRFILKNCDPTVIAQQWAELVLL